MRSEFSGLTVVLWRCNGRAVREVNWRRKMRVAVRMLDACGVRGLALVLCCLALAGCGSDNLARVRGQVTLQGQPLPRALVEFQPVAPGGSPSSGITDAEGRYELMYTFERRGATPGEHVVSIRTGGAFVDENGREVECRECVPPKYNAQTDLRRTVAPGRNTLDFDL
jgi:hypothetical protein